MEYILLAVSALVSGLVNTLGAFRRARPEKILVVKLDHLGDVVTATPVFRSLRMAYPTAPIHAVVGPWGSEVLAGNPFIDRILIYEAGAYRRGAGPGMGAKKALHRIREIASERYTTIVELRGDAWTLLLPAYCGTRTRVDRGTVRIADRLSRFRFKRGRPRDPLHEVETNLAIVRPLLGDAHGPMSSPRVEIFLADEDRRALASTLEGLGLEVRRALVTIHPGASWRPKAWQPERFAALAEQILDRYPVEIVFVGTTEERDIEAKLRLLVTSNRAHYLFDTQSIRMIGVLIERSALMIGNDSGPAHVAAACGTPLITLFGPQDPRRFRPWSETAVALHKPVACFPCRQTVCVRPELPCVNLIEIEEVLAAARSILDRAIEANKG